MMTAKTATTELGMRKFRFKWLKRAITGVQDTTAGPNQFSSSYWRIFQWPKGLDFCPFH